MAVNSKGTFGLPHYRNSRASVEMYEPVYLNLFTVELSLPPALGATNETTNLLLENVMKVGGLQTNKMPAAVTQTYKFANRSFVGGKPDNTYIDISLDFEVNLQRTNSNDQPSAYVLKTLRKWCDLAYDPLTGRMGLKTDYTAPYMIVTVYDKANQPFWQWKFYNIFPTSSIPVPDWDYNSSDIWRIQNFQLRADYWDESII